MNMDRLALTEKSLREMHVEYSKLKEKSDRYQAIIKAKHLDNSDVLQSRVDELNRQLKMRERLEKALNERIAELEDDVMILKAQLRGEAPTSPVSGKKVLAFVVYIDFTRRVYCIYRKLAHHQVDK